MLEENVELVKRALAAWSERNFDAMRTLLHPDAEYHGGTAQLDEQRVSRGEQEVLRRITLLDSEFDEFQMEPLEFIDAGERVVVVAEVSGIGRQSRAPVRFTEAFVCTIRERQMARIEACGTRERALEVAGVEE